MSDYKFFEVLPGEMQYIDSPEGEDHQPVTITVEEVNLIQQFAKGAFVNDSQQDEKSRFLQLMYERCPFVTPSNTLH